MCFRNLTAADLDAFEPAVDTGPDNLDLMSDRVGDRQAVNERIGDVGVDLLRWIGLGLISSLIGTVAEMGGKRSVENIDFVADVTVVDEYLVDLLVDARSQRAMEVQFADASDQVCAPGQPTQATSAGAHDVAMVESEPKDVIGAQ